MTKDMKANKLQFKGIVRRTHNRTTTDGACAEMIDLRLKDGAWEAVGDKEQIEELESAEQFVYHPINARWEVYVYRLDNSIKAKILDKEKGTSSAVTLMTGISGTVILKPFYNSLVVSSVDKYSFKIFIFQNDTGSYQNQSIKIDEDDFSIELFPDYKDDRGTEISNGLFSVGSSDILPGIKPVDNTTDDVNYAVVGGDAWKSDNAAKVEKIFYDYIKEKQENFNILLGHVFLQITITTVDGIEIPIGGIKKIETGYITLYHLLNSDTTRFKAFKNLYSLNISQSFVSKLDTTYKNLFSKINVYISNPLNIELYKPAERYDITYKWFGEYAIEQVTELRKVISVNLTAQNIENNKLITHPDSYTENVLNTYIDISKINYYDIFKFSLFPLQTKQPNLATTYSSIGEQLTAIDTPHTLVPLKNMSIYNQRLIMAGVGVKLSSGYSISKMVSKELAKQPFSIITNAKYNETTYLKVTKTAKQSSSAIYYLALYFKIKTDYGSKIVRSKEKKLNYFDPDTGNQIAFALKNVQYPDSRAFEYIVMIRIPAASTSLESDALFSITRKLKKHDFLDLAFDSETFVIRNNYPSDETTGSQLTGTLTYTTKYPEIDNTYKDLNRVQASASGTVFSFPAKYNYRIGMDEVMNVTALTDELSQGQFGQFPLIAFTKGMIWAMEIGASDVFISNIVPLANEVCNNPASITVVRGGILFSTSEGLKILQGKQVKSVSETVEGAIERLPIFGSFTLNTILDRNKLSKYVDSESFKSFLETAKIGYNHYENEIIVCGPGKSYSYLFGLDSGGWTKIKDTFEAFTNQFPHNYGLKGGNIYDLSKENKNTSKVTLIVTRPFNLTQDVYKKIERVVVRGDFDNAEGYLFACTEGAKYRLVSTGSALTTLDQLYLHRTPYSAKSFILVVTANMTAMQYLSEVDVMFSERFTTKLR